MADLHLITGHTGRSHITAADQGVQNAITVGAGNYVLANGRRFEAEIISNNTVRVHDGCLMMNGRFVILESGSYQNCGIASGSSGTKRHDIICVRYEMDILTGDESATWFVSKGTASANTPTDPTITNATAIMNGATTYDMPLYRVVINGLTIEKVEPLFQVLAPMSELQHGFYKQNLLLNGDFQCNQRGQKTYTANKVMYTLDMWRAFNVTVNTRNDGVEVRGLSTSAQGYFTQFIQLGLLETTTYTISAMVDGKLCTFTVTPGGTAKEKDFGTFKISALTLSSWDDSLPQFNYYNNKLKINICPVGTNTLIINYIDVFEGTVAYPHVKEDSATAMMRCRRYLQCGTYFSPWMWYKTSGADMAYRCVLPYEPMVKKPNILNCNAWFYDASSNDEYIDMDGITDITPTDVSAIRDAFELQIVTPLDLNTRCNGFKLVYILSCEHNPNGD